MAGRGAVLRGVLTSALRPSLRDLERYRSHLVDDGAGAAPGGLHATFLGTSTVLLDDGTDQLLFDAFVSPVGVGAIVRRRVRTSPEHVDRVLAQAGATRVRAVFVSHSHHDHALDAPYIAARTGAVVHGSASTAQIGRGGGLPESQLRLLVPGAATPVGAFSVTALASRHSPGTLGGDGAEITAPLVQPAALGDFREGGSFDFLVEHPAATVLVKGSAGFVPGALDGVRADVLLLATAGSVADDARYRDAFLDATVSTVRPRVVVPLHWNSLFRAATPSSRPMGAIRDTWDALVERLGAWGGELVVLRPGASLRYPRER